MARKAALYLRSSKDRHDVSVDSQARELTKFATDSGDLVVVEFSDRVESAKTDDRPGFQAMIAEVKSKSRRFDVLYCYDTSRFSRRQYHAQMYKHLLKSQGVELVFLKLPKTDTILDPIIESLMEAFDEFHSQKSKMDGLRGMRENIKQGWRAGGKAILGYKLDKQVVGSRDGQPLTKSKLVPDPKTFDQVQAYLKGRARGESRRDLQARMSIKVPYSSLVYIEDSALTYAGHTVWNRHREFVDGAYVGPGDGRYRDRSGVGNSPGYPPGHDLGRWKQRQYSENATSRNGRKVDFAETTTSSQARYGVPVAPESMVTAATIAATTDAVFVELRRRLSSERFSTAFHNELFTGDNLTELQAEIQTIAGRKKPQQNHLISQLKKELKDVDKQIADLAAMLTEVKHRRPLIQRIDALEDERQELDIRLRTWIRLRGQRSYR